MHPVDLATLVDRQLKQLPVRRAPHTLLPRVMAAVQAWTGRPWYERAWFTWPLGWQLASVAFLILLVGGSAALVPEAVAAARAAVSAHTGGVMKELIRVAQPAHVTTNVARILGPALLEPLVAYAFALVVLMCLACAAFGTALNRVVFGRA
jgi:hypothetical protein